MMFSIRSSGSLASNNPSVLVRPSVSVCVAWQGTGVKTIEEARESHNTDIEELFGSRFSAEEREQLTELLGRLPLAHTAEACSA